MNINFILDILRKYKVPFNDPCNPGYVGECNCPGSCITDNADTTFLTQSTCVWFDNLTGTQSTFEIVLPANAALQCADFIVNGAIQPNTAEVPIAGTSGFPYTIAQTGTTVTVTSSVAPGMVGDPCWVKLNVTYTISLKDLTDC